MMRPFNLSQIEAKCLLAALDVIADTADGSDDENPELDWLASRAAGKVMINHLRDKLEIFIKKGESKINRG